MRGVRSADAGVRRGAVATTQIEQASSYIRSSAADRAWPRGELNLPRALVTEKAFPENEAVLTTTTAAGDVATVEQRAALRAAARRAQPVRDGRAGCGQRRRRRLAARPRRRRRGGQARALPQPRTGTHPERRGGGVAADRQGERGARQRRDGLRAVRGVRPDPAADGFLQLQAGLELPTDSKAGNEAFWRAALGKTFWKPVRTVVVADARGPRRAASSSAARHAVGRRAADAGHPQQAAARHVNVGVRMPLTDAGRARHAGADLLAVGLVRRRPVRWLAMSACSPVDRCGRCRLVGGARAFAQRAPRGAARTAAPSTPGSAAFQTSTTASPATTA